MTGPAQTIGELLGPLATTAGLELWDVEVNPRAVRVLVDRAGGVDLDSLTELARAVSAALDGRDDLTPGAQYQLEVSSPGVERTLRTPGHYRRFIGSQINVKTQAPLDGARRLEGVLVAADDSGITLNVAGQPVVLTYDQIQKARTVLIWGPAAKTRGQAPSSKGSAASKGRAPMKDAAR